MELLMPIIIGILIGPSYRTHLSTQLQTMTVLPSSWTQPPTLSACTGHHWKWHCKLQNWWPGLYSSVFKTSGFYSKSRQWMVNWILQLNECSTDAYAVMVFKEDMRPCTCSGHHGTVLIHLHSLQIRWCSITAVAQQLLEFLQLELGFSWDLNSMQTALTLVRSCRRGSMSWDSWSRLWMHNDKPHNQRCGIQPIRPV